MSPSRIFLHQLFVLQHQFFSCVTLFYSNNFEQQYIYPYQFNHNEQNQRKNSNVLQSDRNQNLSNMEPFVQCHYCKQNMKTPVDLSCRHTYCTDCLKKEIQNDKIICPVCGTEHNAPASSLTAAKADTVSPYLIGLNSGEPYSVITDESPATIHAECVGCKRTTDLRTCFHCEKPLCADCRGKHYESQKKDVDQSVHSLTNKADQLIILAQGLNASRKGRIQDYKTMKDQISAHVKDLIRRIQDEEADLQKRLDGRIQYESEKISVTEREEQYLKKNKAALDQVANKYRGENNQMVLIKMHKDYLSTAPMWKEKLETHSGRLNVKKEEELFFHPTRHPLDEALVGKLTESKNVNVHAPSTAKRMAAKHDEKDSTTCSIM